MPIAICFGVEPVIQVAAVYAAMTGINEFQIAGALKESSRTLSIIVGWGREGRVLKKLRQEFPTVKDVAYNARSDLFHLVVSMEKKRQGDDLRLLYYIMGLDISVFAKYVTIVDEDIDVHNPDQV
ncbi:MAG: UbiD family decarboxylase [Thaumarchaeota archaeon]|nr:UbiD family decarboxylase [Nitrososphaerota archaeon]